MFDAEPASARTITSTESPAILALIARAQAGDSRAEGELIVKFSPMIESAVRKIGPPRTHDGSRSDLTLEVLRGVRSFNPAIGYRLSTHLRCCISNYRMSRRRKETCEAESPLFSMVGAIVDPDDAIPDEEADLITGIDAKALLEKALSAIPSERSRKWLIQSAMGRPLTEIAEEAGLSVQRISSSCIEMRKMIRERFGSDMAELMAP